MQDMKNVERLINNLLRSENKVIRVYTENNVKYTYVLHNKFYMNIYKTEYDKNGNTISMSKDYISFKRLHTANFYDKYHSTIEWEMNPDDFLNSISSDHPFNKDILLDGEDGLGKYRYAIRENNILVEFYYSYTGNVKISDVTEYKRDLIFNENEADKIF